MQPKINGYVIKCRLGQGSYGTVWEAMREFDQETVAIKTTSDYEREAEVLASINSDYVVDLLGDGALEAGGEYGYIVMPMLYRFRGQHLTDAMLIEYALQLATALRDMEYAGWAHGDMHTGNIMLDEHGNVKVIDFGFAFEGHAITDLDLFSDTIRAQSFYIEDSKFDWGYISKHIREMEEIEDILEYFSSMKKEHTDGFVSLMPLVDK